MQASLPQGVTAGADPHPRRVTSPTAWISSGRQRTDGAWPGAVPLVPVPQHPHRRSGWRSGIPASMFAAVALMYAAGITLNMVSLFGLIITLGIVVDDAIVVGEHADFRVRRLGESPGSGRRERRAAHGDAGLCRDPHHHHCLLWPDPRGRAVRRADPGYSVHRDRGAGGLLVECFLILPNHLAHALDPCAQARHWYDWPNRMVNRGFRWLRDHAVPPADGLHRHWARYAVWPGRWQSVLASQAALFINGDVQWRFFNAPERGSVTGNFAMVEGAKPRRYNGDDAWRCSARQRRWGREYAERYGRNPLDFVMAETGGNAGRGSCQGWRTPRTPICLGGISIELIDADLRPYSSFRLCRQSCRNGWCAAPDGRDDFLSQLAVGAWRRRAGCAVLRRRQRASAERCLGRR